VKSTGCCKKKEVTWHNDSVASMRYAKAPTCKDSDAGEVSFQKDAGDEGVRAVEMLRGEMGLPILAADLSQIPK
jgi:hypothetical protein